MKAAGPLDAGGVTDYERERLRKGRQLVSAAISPAVRQFSVPTTALLKSGQLGAPLLLKRRKFLKVAAAGLGGSILTATVLPHFLAPTGRIASVGVGYGPLQAAQTSAAAASYAATVRAATQPVAIFAAPSAPRQISYGSPVGGGYRAPVAGSVAQPGGVSQPFEGISHIPLPPPKPTVITTPTLTGPGGAFISEPTRQQAISPGISPTHAIGTPVSVSSQGGVGGTAIIRPGGRGVIPT